MRDSVQAQSRSMEAKFDMQRIIRDKSALLLSCYEITIHIEL